MKRPVWALYVLIVGLALHNLVMSQLWRAGVRGNALSAVAAWKDVLLLVALALVIRARRGLPFKSSAADWLAVAFGAVVVLYGVLPQSLLGGGATHKGVVYAARHDLLPVGAYFLGRGLDLTADERRRVRAVLLVTAGCVALYGLLDVYLVSLSWWRESAGWFREQLGLPYRGLSGLPENFVYNEGNGVVFRRLTSSFLSPLATAYMLVVALLAVRVRLRGWLGWPIALVLFAALLLTHTRAGLLALVLALLVRAVLERSRLDAAFAAAVAAIALVFVVGYDHVGPRTHFTRSELQYQEQHAHQVPERSNDATSANEASTSEHLSSLRSGADTAFHHPWGFGLGNAGVTAARTHVTIEAGESTYTELAVETGLVGALLFIGWCAALFRRLLGQPWLAASFAGVLFVGLQTDVIGVPWIAVVVWALGGDEA